MSLSRRPGVPPSKPADAPVSYPGEAVPHLEALARTAMPVDRIVEEIERLRAGRTRFVDAALAAPEEWAPNAKLPAAEPIGDEFDEPAADDLSFLDFRPPADQPHSSMLKKPRRIGARRSWSCRHTPS